MHAAIASSGDEEFDRRIRELLVDWGVTASPDLIAEMIVTGVLPTVVSSGAIWTEIEPGFHIELEAPVRIDVLPD